MDELRKTGWLNINRRLLRCWWIHCAVSDVLLGRQAFNYVEKFGASVPTLPAAVTLCKLLSCLASKTDMDELQHRTSECFS